MPFPSYEASGLSTKPVQTSRPSPKRDDHSSQLSSPTDEAATDKHRTTQDDHAIELEPTRHVDYLSHQWKEEDIWLSWSYVVHRRGNLANDVRLENASWRSWMKAKNHLRTVSPETLNWFKDCDVTWLYGPFQTNGIETQLTSNTSPPPRSFSHSSSTNSIRPILKKKSASATVLERSRSRQSLLQGESDIIRVQQSSPVHISPVLRRGNHEFALPQYTKSSVASTPTKHDLPRYTGRRSSFVYPVVSTPSECKHVQFDIGSLTDKNRFPASMRCRP